MEWRANVFAREAKNFNCDNNYKTGKTKSPSLIREHVNSTILMTNKKE